MAVGAEGPAFGIVHIGLTRPRLDEDRQGAEERLRTDALSQKMVPMHRQALVKGDVDAYARAPRVAALDKGHASTTDWHDVCVALLLEVAGQSVGELLVPVLQPLSRPGHASPAGLNLLYPVRLPQLVLTARDLASRC